MKKRWMLLLVCLLPLLLFAACGKERFDPAQLRERYTGPAFSAQYTVTTHAGFYTVYQLSCDCADGISTVTVREPRSVAGIRAVMQEDNTRLQYGEISLDALLPEVAGFAPMDVLHGVLEDLRQGEPAQYGKENGLLTVEYRKTVPGGQQAVKVITLDPQTLDVKYAECYLGDSLILSLEITQLEWSV